MKHGSVGGALALVHHNDPAVAAGQICKGSALPPGVTARGSFSCEARCFCPYGDTVWVNERTGIITVRSARNGDVLHAHEIRIPNKTIFANTMKLIDHEMWCGTTEGKIVIFDASSGTFLAELSNPEAQSAADIFDIAFDGVFVFAATANCRAGQWEAKSKKFVRSLLHTHPVRAVLQMNCLVYAGDDSGAVVAWDVRSGERISSVADSTHGVTAMTLEGATNTLWVARSNGSVDVYAMHPTLVRIETSSEATGKLTTLTSVGGKVWGGGFDKTIYIWHASTRKLLGKIKDHHSFLFAVGKVYALETARIWSLSNDKTIHIYDGEGFFAPIKGYSAVSDEVASLHAQLQHAKMTHATTEKLLFLEKDRVASHALEVERIREELSQQTVKISAMQFALDTRDDTIVGQQMNTQKLLDEIQSLSKKIADMTVQVNALEKEKAQLRGDFTRSQEELSRTRLQIGEKQSTAAIAEADKVALANDKARLTASLVQKDNQIAMLQDEARKLRDSVAARSADLTKKDQEIIAAQEKVVAAMKERDAACESAKLADEAKKRVESTVILKEHEVKDLLNQLAGLRAQTGGGARDVAELTRMREQDQQVITRLQDALVLRNHEYDNLAAEKNSVAQQLDFEKHSTHDARNNETKLRLANEELRRQIEIEKNNVKMLQDQYTIFQFVINSRGELVQHVWSLHNKSSAATKTIHELETHLKATDPTEMDKLTLKREWRSSVVDRMRNSAAALGEVHKLTEYIVANYFSEYEKQHLGISTSKYPPDPKRPAIVGDQLLSKLRDVTLMKQFATPGGGKDNGAMPRPLPPPYDASMGPQHNSSQLAQKYFSSPIQPAGQASSMSLNASLQP
jgi:hypothetical protein